MVSDAQGEVGARSINKSRRFAALSAGGQRTRTRSDRCSTGSTKIAPYITNRSLTETPERSAAHKPVAELPSLSAGLEWHRGGRS